MNVHFVSRSEARKMIALGTVYDYDFISISDTNNEKNSIRNDWTRYKENDAAAIFLNFHDIDGIESGFTEAKSRKIIQFSKKSFEKRKDVLVHCFMGISRSGAVAKYINDYYMLGNQYLTDYAGHNRWIYYELLEQSGQETLRSYYKNLETSPENA